MINEKRFDSWAIISSEILDFISKIEIEINKRTFPFPDDRFSLTKINKKLYEAFEIAEKAYTKTIDD